MKKLLCLTIALAALNCMLHVGQAQPPDPPPDPAIALKRESVVSPIYRIRQVFNTLSKFNTPHDPGWGARTVVGAKDNPAALVALEDELRRIRGDLVMSVRPINIDVKDDDARVTMQVTLQNHILKMTQIEQVSVRWEEGAWKIVPADPKSLARDENSGIILRLATCAAYPEAVLEMRKAASLSKVKQLVLGLLQFLIDSEMKFKLKAETFEKDIISYTGSDLLFYSPADQSGEVSYVFNRQLEDLSYGNIATPEKTIMIYEGKDGQLNFAHDGYATVSFVDGHVEMVNAEQAKNLSWEPQAVK